MCNLQVSLLNRIISFRRLGSWSKTYGCISPFTIISMWGLQTNFFVLRLVGAATILHQKGKWFTPQDLLGTGVCGDSSGTRVFCTFTPAALLAGLPSTSKSSRALREGLVGSNRRNSAWFVRNGFTVLFNKTRSGYEKYQWSRAYLLSAA